MKLLALDTSTDACSAALAIGDRLSERLALDRQHSSCVLAFVDELLAEAGVALRELDAIAFGRGPGMFTGLRIGAGVVQGLAFGADLPVVPISSLAALAQGQDHVRVLAAIDARMSQVYWGAYERGRSGLMESVGKEAVLAPDQVPLPSGEGWLGVGSGWDQHAERLRARLGGSVSGWKAGVFPLARHVIALARAQLACGHTVLPEQALPVYLRDEVTQSPRG